MMPGILKTSQRKQRHKMPDVQAKFRAASVEPVGNSPGEMAAFIAEETRRWSDIIKKNNIVVD